MTHRCLLLAATWVIALCSADVYATDRVVVLIVPRNSPVATLDAHDVRLLFLGHDVRVAGQSLRPIRNLSDSLLDRGFLQYVVAMTGAGYDRYVLRRTMQQGVPRPPEYAARADLFDALSRDPLAVTYAWQSDVRGNPQIRAVRVLWRD